MKKFLILLLLYSTSTYSQQINEDAIYTSVNKMPEFPGGTAELMKFLSKKIEVTEKDLADGFEGKLQLNFIVEKNGALSEIEIISGGGKEFKRRIEEVINEFPCWSPGVLHGTPVRVRYQLPVRICNSK